MGKQEKIKERAGRIYDATLGKRVAKMSLEQQVELVRKIPLPMVIKRKGILESLPTDIKEFAKQGMSQGQIKNYYWSCEAFKKFWLSLELEEATLDELIRGSLEVQNATA
jgi:hypothetical protein